MRRMYSKEQLERIAQEQAKVVKKDIATLVDSQGHDRFIEGDITIETIEGVTQTYGKWSLSGTHLIIVLGLSLGDTSVISSNAKLCSIPLPNWILNKIYPLFDQIVVDRQTFNAWSDSYTTQQVTLFLTKSSNALNIANASNITLTANRNIRIVFDLLIDNE